MANTTLADAEVIFQQAVRTESKFDWFTTFKQVNQEEASELFARAGAKFKASRDYARAGASYERAAKAAAVAQWGVDALQSLREAGRCYARAKDLPKAKCCFDKSIQTMLDEDKFQAAAKVHLEMGKMLEEDYQTLEAIAEYDKAIELYEIEHVTSAANKQRLVIAHLCAAVNQFDRAIALFESSVQVDGVQRFAAKTHLFKAFLCHVAQAYANDENDPSVLCDVVDRYARRTDAFAQSREGQFCVRAVSCFNDWDDIRYATAVSDLSRGLGMGEWETRMIDMGAQLIRRNQYREPSLQGIDDDSRFLADVVDARACPFDPPVMTGDEPDL